MQAEVIDRFMDFEPTESERMVAATARDFAKKEIAPFIMEWDEQQWFPFELFQKMGDLGLMGMLVPESLGGSGLGYYEYVAAIVEITKVDPSDGLSLAAHNSLCTNHILTFGNQAQKEKYIPRLASGEWAGAWGLTEPNTGSDAGNMRTTAVKDGEYWVINGAKNFITNGKCGQIATVIVRTGEVGDSHGMTAFVIEKGTPGFSAGKKENKMGMRASETAELIFNDCRVHESQILGESGRWFCAVAKDFGWRSDFDCRIKPGHRSRCIRSRFGLQQRASPV